MKVHNLAVEPFEILKTFGTVGGVDLRCVRLLINVKRLQMLSVRAASNLAIDVRANFLVPLHVVVALCSERHEELVEHRDELLAAEHADRCVVNLAI